MSELDQKVAQLFRDSEITLSIAESCSGGLISKRITDLPGSSGYFNLGVVTYSNSSKERVLGVPHELIEINGAVSSEVALAMAAGIRALSGSTVALATTGIAGPEGGTSEKPVGTVFIAIVSQYGSDVLMHHFDGNRATVREATAEAALMLLVSWISSGFGS